MAMRDKLTGKQERYARFLFEGMAEGKAYLEAGYSPKTGMATMAANASRLAKNAKVIAKIEQLTKAAEDASVATVLERKQVLTEIVRGRFADFMANLTKEKLKSAALQEIRITEGEGGKTTTIKLHNPIQAITELNKMEKVYVESGPVFNIDNRSVHVEAKQELFDLLSRIAARIGEAGIIKQIESRGDSRPPL